MSEDYDVAIVGASLAGSAAAILLGRAGARVALIEQRPDPQAFKRVCSHFIQGSAVPTLERLGLLEPIAAAGGVRSHARLHTRWGLTPRPADPRVLAAVNVRREVLDPMVRELAAATDGVDLLLGRKAEALLPEGGVETLEPSGVRTRVPARLVVGADGRDSHVAKLAGARERIRRHGRFAYGAYYEGPGPENAPDATIWLLDPDFAAAFPTDSGLTFYAAMPTMARLPEFKADPAGALDAYLRALPDAPPMADSRRVSAPVGKLSMPNTIHEPAPRAHAAEGGGSVALIGDAALATDPLWGVGCGWAAQSAEWLADAVAPALRGEEPLERGLRRYRREHRRRLRGHAFLIHDYATGRKLSPVERLLFSAASRDQRLADRMSLFGIRAAPARTIMSPALLARAAAVDVRHALRGARAGSSPAAPAAASR
ncbi:MAG TPA: NAD(P)/FAD-dependent oxidoreductase [Solirubrobacteraceae bacterium]|nr:NAD(P)/FAD-dependent oxidoreductase [Solirubrobacteraceae bacterium]